MMPFADRADAGRQLAQALDGYRRHTGLLVLGLPRGGVPVAAPVARALGAPLDVLTVRKLGHPLQPEFALGAIASGGIRVLSQLPGMPTVGERELDRIAEAEGIELRRREQAYRGARPLPVIAGRTVILVDDGLATGATMRAAVQAVRSQSPATVVAAAPVGSREAVAALSLEADAVVCVAVPEDFLAVGAWYRDFGQTRDEEVRALLG